MGAVAAEMATAAAFAVDMMAARTDVPKKRSPLNTAQQRVALPGASSNILSTPMSQQALLRGRLVSSPKCQDAASLVPSALEDDAQGQRHEAAAYYYFSRLLADERSQLGLAHAAFTEAFLERHAGSNEESEAVGRHTSAMREALKAVAGLCNSIEVVVGGDQGAAALGTLGPWLHTSVERCVFSHVGSAVWDLYEEHFVDDDRAYTRKVQALAREAPEQLILRLGVREALSPARRRVGAPASPPYARAITALSRLGSSLRSAGLPSPSEVARLLSAAQLEMRTGALEATRGASELLAMDDVLPVFVFVLSRSELRCPFALAAYAEDALSPQARLGADGWAVRLLESSARYIAYELESSDSRHEVDEGSTSEKEGALTMKSRNVFQGWGEGCEQGKQNDGGFVARATRGSSHEATEGRDVSEPSFSSGNAEGAFAQPALDDCSQQSKGGLAVCKQTMSNGCVNAASARATYYSPGEPTGGVDQCEHVVVGDSIEGARGEQLRP